MFTRLRHGLTPTLLMGLATCAVLFGASSLVSEASPLLQTPPLLGNAASFAVLGGSTVTNTGPTIVNADLGVSPGTAVTGFPPGLVVGGTIHAADALAARAQTDTTTAYNSLAGQPCPALNHLTGQDLGGKMLTPGVYCFSSSAQLTGTLTLDALGNASSLFIFQIGSTLTTATNSSVVMINGGSPCNVFWQIGSSATLNTTTRFIGSLLALTSISLNTGATVSGRALAQNGAVTMDSNTIGTTACVAGLATATPAPTATPVPPTPTPRPAPTAVLVPTTAPAAVAATVGPTATASATSVAVPLATATSAAAATTTTSAAETATPTGGSSASAGATQTAVAASAASSAGTANTSAASAPNAAEAVPTAILAETAIALTAAPAVPIAATPLGLAGRAGGLDPVVIAAGLGLLGALAIGGGMLRRRRRSG